MITSHVRLGAYTLISAVNEESQPLEFYRAHAAYFGAFQETPTARETFLLAVGDERRFPALAVSITYQGQRAGAAPSALLAAETGMLFVGAGKTLYGFDLNAPRLLWSRIVDSGFGCWSRQGDLILMSAVTEVAAWNLQGAPLWTTHLEPSCTYRVDQGMIHLDVINQPSTFSLAHGIA